MDMKLIKPVVIAIALILTIGGGGYYSYFLFNRHSTQHAYAESNFRSISQWGGRVENTMKAQSETIKLLEERLQAIEKRK